MFDDGIKKLWCSFLLLVLLLLLFPIPFLPLFLHCRRGVLLTPDGRGEHMKRLPCVPTERSTEYHHTIG